MTLRVDIPDEAVATLRAALGDDLDRAAFEAMIVEGYRTGRLSLGAIATLLGHATRLQTESWLAARGVCWNYDEAALEADRAALDRLLSA